MTNVPYGPFHEHLPLNPLHPVRLSWGRSRQVIIDWNEELAMLIEKQIKLDPELIDMHLFEDAFDDDLGIVIPNAYDVLVLASP